MCVCARACTCMHTLPNLGNPIKSKLKGKRERGNRERGVLQYLTFARPPGASVQRLSSPQFSPHLTSSFAFGPGLMSCCKSKQKPAGLSSELGCLSGSDLLLGVGRLPSIPHFCQMKKTWIWAPSFSRGK